MTGSSPTALTAEPLEPATETLQPKETMTEANEPLSPAAALARADLAKRLQKPLAAIEFLREYSDEFPADNLGCLGPGVTPRPIPAIVSGRVIQFKVGETIYNYHSRGSELVFCGPWE